MNILIIYPNNSKQQTHLFLLTSWKLLWNQNSFILELIQEVANFKYFIKGYVEDLVGLKKMHIFKFFVENDGWLVFQYKNLHLIQWLPWNNLVFMWKDDGCDHPLIPSGKLSALQIRPPWGHAIVKCYGDKEVIIKDSHDVKRIEKKSVVV